MDVCKRVVAAREGQDFKEEMRIYHTKIRRAYLVPEDAYPPERAVELELEPELEPEPEPEPEPGPEPEPEPEGYLLDVSMEATEPEPARTARSV